MQVVERHAREDLFDTRVFRRAVVTDIAVPFVADIMVFRVEPACAFWMTVESVHHHVIVP